MIRSTSYEARLLEALRDPAEAAAYLTAALADGERTCSFSRSDTSRTPTGGSAGWPNAPGSTA